MYKRQPLTPISTQDENKPDETAALMQLLLTKFDNFNIKLDEQKSDFNVKYTNLNDKFDNFDKQFNEQKTEIRNSFDVNFDELKTEIKR